MRSGGSTHAGEVAHVLLDGGILQLLESTWTEGTLWVLCSFSEKNI